jgi:hypothetical protein
MAQPPGSLVLAVWACRVSPLWLTHLARLLLLPQMTGLLVPLVIAKS